MHDVQGGAARAAYRLHQGLQRAGAESLVFAQHQHSADPAVTAYEPPTDPRARAVRKWRALRLTRSLARYERPDGYEWFAPAHTPYGADVLAQLPAADVANLHWVSDFIDLPAVLPALDGPVVWTLHDMNAFTGGCHYDDGCGRFLSQCGACPQLGSTRERDLSRRIWEQKQATYAALSPDRFRIVTPSRWLGEQARRSPLLGRFDVRVIPYGLDLEEWAPGPAGVARQFLGLPEDAVVLLFVAESARNRRKGFGLLVEALRGVAHPERLCLLSVGKRPEALPGQIRHVHLGSVGHNGLLSVAYAAADAFVMASLQDNLPNTVLEALACGTPTIGFDTGGVPDMVRPGETGWLAPVGDVRALRACIEHVAAHPAERAQMAGACRAVAERDYALDLQARRYLDLYHELLHGAPAASPTAAHARP